MPLPKVQIGFEIECGLIEDDHIGYLGTENREAISRITGGLYEFDYDGSVSVNYPYDETEIRIGPFGYRSAVNKLRKVFEWMQGRLGRRSRAITNRSCGLHVNISLIDEQDNLAIDPLACIVMLKQHKELKKYGREGNAYCEPHRLMQTIRTFKNLPVAARMEWVKRRYDYFDDKYRTVNFDRFWDDYYGPTSDGWVEFRIIGGEDYHKRKNWDKVRESIKHYVDCIRKSACPRKSRREFKEYCERMKIAA
jgi:hypothetical protein